MVPKLIIRGKGGKAMNGIFAAKIIIRVSLGLLNLGLAAFFLAGVAFAGDQYLDREGYAVGGYDVVTYHTLVAPVPGSTDITAQHNGAVWLFANEANRDRFLDDPVRYAPAYDGHCAYALAEDRKVRTDPLAYMVLDGQLYMNFSPRIQTRWEADIPGHLERSEANWPRHEPEPAARPSRWS
jgi:YHS domain-containing protein